MQNTFLQTSMYLERSKPNKYPRYSISNLLQQDLFASTNFSSKSVLNNFPQVLSGIQRRNRIGFQNNIQTSQFAAKIDFKNNSQRRRIKSSLLIRNEIENSKKFLNSLKEKHQMLLSERPINDRQVVQIMKENSTNSTQADSQRSLNEKLLDFHDKGTFKVQQQQRQTLNKQLSIQDFDIINFCGQGAFGSVYVAKHIESGSIYALKKIQKSKISSKKDKQSLIRQIQVHFQLNHPNIVKLYDFFSDENSIYLVLELCCFGNLHQTLRKHGIFSQKDVISIIRQICHALNYLHKKNIIHRDITAKNIVIQDKIVKLCDFGRAIQEQQLRKSFGGTPAYISPQIIQNKPYDRKVDVWSLGILTFELIYGKTPFDIRSSDDLNKIIKDNLCLPLKNQISEVCKHFITKCLQKDSKKDGVLRIYQVIHSQWSCDFVNFQIFKC